TAILGIYDLITKISNLFEQQRPDPFQLLVEHVQHIETTLNSLFDWNENANWTRVLTEMTTASAELRNFIDRTIVVPGPRPELLTDADRDRLFDNVIHAFRDVRFNLLPPPEIGTPVFQQSRDKTILPIDFAYNAWAVTLAEHDKEERVNAAAL